MAFSVSDQENITVIGNWDVGEGSWTYRPLLSALEKPHYDFCDLFLEAGARVNFCETTSISEDTMRHFMSSIEDTTINRFRDLADSRRRGSMRLASTPLAPLHIAVTKGNVELVELFLRHGADPNLHAELFGTALHFTKDIGIAKLLVANGADVNARNGLGASPLFIALDRGKKDLFTMLIEAGANVDLVADNDDTLLNLAIKRRAGTFVELLLDADYISILYNGGTALHTTPCLDTASLLLSYGADIDKEDCEGSTPFMLAASSRNLRLMEVLILAGAEVCPIFLRDCGILHSLVRAGAYHILKSIISRCDLRLAFDEGEYGNGYGDEDGDESGDKNLLYLAIIHFQEGIANLLIEAVPHLVFEDGINHPYMLEAAALRSSSTLLKKIIDLRTKVEAVDMEFFNTLVVLFNTDRVDAVRMLPKALIQPARLGQHVDLPLIVATAGRDAVLEKIENAIEMHSTKWMSDSELWVEPTYKDIETNYSILQTLLDYGADVSQAEWEGMGILHVAAWRNDERLMEMLLATGANPLFKDSMGHTPAYWAAQMSHHKMEKMLRLAEAEAVAKQPKEKGSS
uniref:Ankyrin-1 n=1 Tax=Talaromyces marneffei PM1 TaxID=1077442 RepID=A0A093V0G3_TALMA